MIRRKGIREGRKKGRDSMKEGDEVTFVHALTVAPTLKPASWSSSVPFKPRIVLRRKDLPVRYEPASATTATLLVTVFRYATASSLTTNSPVLSSTVTKGMAAPLPCWGTAAAAAEDATFSLDMVCGLCFNDEKPLPFFETYKFRVL